MDVMFSKDILVNTEWKAGTVRAKEDGTGVVMGVEVDYSRYTMALVLESEEHFRFTLLNSYESEIIEEYPIVIKGSRIVLGGINV